MPADKQQEVLDLVNFLKERHLEKKPLKSLYGLWKDQGISTSEEDIAEARKEMCATFPREQFFQ